MLTLFLCVCVCVLSRENFYRGEFIIFKKKHDELKNGDDLKFKDLCCVFFIIISISYLSLFCFNSPKFQSEKKCQAQQKKNIYIYSCAHAGSYYDYDEPNERYNIYRISCAGVYIYC